MAELYTTSMFGNTELKAYYRLEGNSNDAKGSHNGSDTSISYGTSYGKYAQGADFNGTSSKISFTDHADFKPTATYSISFWIKTTTANGYVFSTANTRTGPNVFEGIEVSVLSNVVVVAHCYTPGGTDVSTTTGTVAVNTGLWVHVVITYSSNTCKIYVNGVQDVSTGSRQDAVYNATNYVFMGCRAVNGSASGFMTMSIDDFGLWNGKALSATEVIQLYTEQSGILLFA